MEESKIVKFPGKWSDGDSSEWGPKRTAYAVANPPKNVTFNSFTDNPIWGDERRFIRVQDIKTGKIFRDVIEIKPGGEYEAQIFYANDGDERLNAALGTVARDFRLFALLPKRIAADQPDRIRVEIAARNASPEKVWDSVRLETNSEAAVDLEFCLASAIIHNQGKKDGAILATWLFDPEKGVSLGFDELDGELPGGARFSGYVTFRFIARQLKARVEHRVSLDERKYSGSVIAEPGRIVTNRVRFYNLGNTDLTNVCFHVKQSAGLSLVPGSTYLYNNANPDGLLMVDVLDKNGFNTGLYGPGTYAEILYRVKIQDNLTTEQAGKLTSIVFVDHDHGEISAGISIHLPDADREVIQAVKAAAAPKVPVEEQVRVGRLKLADGSLYTGEIQNGIAQGRGVLIDKDGMVYEGNFVDGKKNGRFLCKYPTGSVYEEYKNGERVFR